MEYMFGITMTGNWFADLLIVLCLTCFILYMLVAFILMMMRIINGIYVALFTDDEIELTDRYDR